MRILQSLCTAAAAVALAANPALAASDEAFVKEAASGSLLEVQLGSHAAENAESPAVRDFGRQMADDHAEMATELQRLALEAHPDLAFPAEPNAEHRKVAARLTAMHGAQLDGAYIEEMVRLHEKAVKDFQAHAESVDSPIAAWAGASVATLQSHLERAQEIEKNLAREAAGSGDALGP